MEMGVDFDWGRVNGHGLWQMKILVRNMEIPANYLYLQGNVMKFSDKKNHVVKSAVDKEYIIFN